VFLASSVVASLRNNQALEIIDLDLVACPVESCTTAPNACEKGRNGACEKNVYISYEHDRHNKAVLLRLYYQLRGYDREGFIKSTDRGLNVLINRGIILRANLIESRPV